MAFSYLQLKVYNGKTWKKKSGNCWDHWKVRLDTTYDTMNPMKNLVDQLVASANADMDTKKWETIKQKGSQSGKSYREKYQNYSRGRPYAR